MSSVYCENMLDISSELDVESTVSASEVSFYSSSEIKELEESAILLKLRWVRHLVYIHLYILHASVFFVLPRFMYRIDTSNVGFTAAGPEGFIWRKADVRSIYPTYLIVEEVSKTIKIQGMYLYTSLTSQENYWNYKFKGCICIHPLNL